MKQTNNHQKAKGTNSKAILKSPKVPLDNSDGANDFSKDRKKFIKKFGKIKIREKVE